MRGCADTPANQDGRPSVSADRGHWGNQDGLALCRHPATPIAAIEALLRDRRVTSQVRRRIAATTTRPDVRAILLRDPSSVVRQRAAERLRIIDSSADDPPPDP
ncbi:MAG: hypothetical protein OHK0015_46810 [Chloroflexi bacterium OHK40]